MAKKTRFRLPVNTGVKSDGFAEDVPLMDINNFVLVPDGSALRPREGYEIRRNDGIGFGATRKQIYFVSNPPDINYGDMLIISNPANERRAIECTEVVRTTNTVATENPLAMPSLPATGTPLMYMFHDPGDGLYTGLDLLLYDTDSAAFTNRVTANFTRPYLYSYAQFNKIVRTDNYLVVSESYDYNDGPGSTTPASPNSYLHVMNLADPSQFERLVTIELPPFGDNDPSDYPNQAHNLTVYPYSNDRVLVVCMNYLFSVALSTGVVTTISSSITPPADSYYNTTMDNQKQGGVDVNGDLWSEYYPASNGLSNGRAVVRLNPSTAAVTLDVNHIVTNGSYAPSGYSVPLPASNGDMYEIQRVLTTAYFSKTSGAGVRSEAYDTLAGIASVYTGRNAMLGTKILGRQDSTNYPVIIDAAAGTITATASTAVSDMTAVVPYDANHFVFTTLSGPLYKINVTDATLTQIGTAADLIEGDVFLPIGDAFAYGLTNIQGARI